jgi:hypothetical protein
LSSPSSAMGKIRYKVKTRPTRICGQANYSSAQTAFRVYANEFGTS